MKIFLTTILLPLLLIMSLEISKPLSPQSKVLKGKITSKLTNKGIPQCKILFYQNDKFIDATQSDPDGYYRFTNLTTGDYRLEAIALNYPVHTTTLSIQDDQEYNIAMGADQNSGIKDAENIYDEVISTESETERKSPIKSPTIAKLGSKDELKYDGGSTDKSEPAKLYGLATAPSTSKSKVKKTRHASASYADAATAEDKKVVMGYMDVDGDGVPAHYAKSKESTSHSLITAGEWCDLHHWEKWNELLANEEYKSASTYWRLNTKERYSMLITNTESQPMHGIAVSLVTKDLKVKWSGITDAGGKAELWADVLGKGSDEALYISIDGKYGVPLTLAQKYSKAINHIKIRQACTEIHRAQIAFVVDATGSMGDEIEYLKSDMQHVIDAIKNQNNTIGIETTAVFYRDYGDAYVTRSSSFTNDVATTSKFISEQNGDGGGDTPEALIEGMEAALMQKWDTNTQTVKIIYLLLDAPPHYSEENLLKYKVILLRAAELGIKVIPIASSGIDRETEFLLKFSSVLTNATYVFITDDSGIGNPHLAPTHNDFKVETLSEILIRLCNAYTTIECNQNYDQDRHAAYSKVTPNPARDYINIQYKAIPKRISITTLTGQELYSIAPDSSPQRVSIDNLISGLYNVILEYEGYVKSMRFIVAR